MATMAEIEAMALPKRGPAHRTAFRLRHSFTARAMLNRVRPAITV